MISAFSLNSGTNSSTMVNNEDNYLGYAAYGEHVVGDMSCVDELVKRILPDNTKFFLIESIFVNPAARGKGYGTKFLDNILNIARENGISEVLAFIPVVDETESVFSGVEWLKRHGFVKVPGEGLEDVFMLKHLD